MSPLNPRDRTLNSDEEALVRAFITPERRGRFLKLLATPRGRERLLRRLGHQHDLDSRFAHRIPPRDQNPATIYRLLWGLSVLHSR